MLNWVLRASTESETGVFGLTETGVVRNEADLRKASMGMECKVREKLRVSLLLSKIELDLWGCHNLSYLMREGTTVL